MKAAEILIRGPVLPRGFGDGWMSKPAEEMLRVAITIAGFEPKLFMRVLMRRTRGMSEVQERHVLEVMDLLYREEKKLTGEWEEEERERKKILRKIGL